MHESTDCDASAPESVRLRLLPWQGPEGRPARLHGDDGALSRLADEIEEAQLASARSVWDVAPAVLDEPTAELRDVRFAARRLHECLGDVLRVVANREAYGFDPAGAPRSPYVRRLTYDLRCVGRARHGLRRAVVAWGLDGLADTAELVLSELLTNAVRHADVPDDSEIEIRFERLPVGVRIEVHDADGTRPRSTDPATDAESGRGLSLVDALTSGQWGVSERNGVGKCVWAVCCATEGP